ncbi:MAG: hypothetical protein LZF62_380014 [Nitrospira sp.]|nr:MAG: hypothetical protein LZF62_380014 [Nitrospira sp.]
MSERHSVSCRVDFRILPVTTFTDQSGRLECLWGSGCTIQTPLHIDPAAMVELRIYLSDGQWPLRIDCARITWSHWTSFSVEFVTLSAEDQSRLEAYLASSQDLEGTSRIEVR